MKHMILAAFAAPSLMVSVAAFGVPPSRYQSGSYDNTGPGVQS
jgi:hypothetical protein